MLLFGLPELVAFVVHGYVRGCALVFKPVIAFLQVSPEFVPAVVRMIGKLSIRHAEGEDMNSEERLAVFQGEMAKGVDLLNEGVCHGKATNRNLVAD